ncbi:MAG: Hpt domain-containing protein [bacterium]|nr:Hpt domain-containing protein [bacterium]
MGDLMAALEQRGCDMRGIQDRFLGDEAFYAECFEQFMSDEGFRLLGEQLCAHKVREAFDTAHTLKGLASNMGLTDLFNHLVVIVEPLRKGCDDGLLPVYEEMLACYETYRAL